jgi:hypothetical protein
MSKCSVIFSIYTALQSKYLRSLMDSIPNSKFNLGLCMIFPEFYRDSRKIPYLARQLEKKLTTLPAVAL